MRKLRKIYEGKGKILYETEEPDLLIQHFKDEGIALDGKGRAPVGNKGVLNNKISSAVFQHLERRGVPTHFVKALSDREMLVKRLEMVPIEVVMRNVAAGSLCRRLGLEEGTPLPAPVLEFYYKSDALGDPMINEHHVQVLGLASPAEVRAISELAFRINRLLLPYFAERDILLVDFKVEFGKQRGRLLVGDEITPDGCRFWDRTVRARTDRDRFRRLGGTDEAYQEIYRRVCG